MGQIRIECVGSFNPRQCKTVSAMQSGHAVAVKNAIAWLQDEVLPVAKAQDRALRADGHAPADSFAEADRLGLLVEPARGDYGEGEER